MAGDGLVGDDNNGRVGARKTNDENRGGCAGCAARIDYTRSAKAALVAKATPIVVAGDTTEELRVLIDLASNS